MLSIWTEILSRGDLEGGYIHAPDAEGKMHFYPIKQVRVNGEFISFEYDWQVEDDGSTIKQDFEGGAINVMGDRDRHVDASYDRINFVLLGGDVTIYPKDRLMA